MCDDYLERAEDRGRAAGRDGRRLKGEGGSVRAGTIGDVCGAGCLCPGIGQVCGIDVWRCLLRLKSDEASGSEKLIGSCVGNEVDGSSCSPTSPTWDRVWTCLDRCWCRRALRTLAWIRKAWTLTRTWPRIQLMKYIAFGVGKPVDQRVYNCKIIWRLGAARGD